MNKKIVLITGTSSGIGLALAKEFNKQGFKVYGTSRHPGKSGSDDIETLAVDMTDLTSIKSCVDTIIQKEGKIDILVNNAGYGLMGPIAELSIEDLTHQFNTNVIGLVSITQQVIPYMIKNGSGMIVNISSLAPILTMAFSGAYSASKASVNSISEALRLELKPFNIKVIIVQPGAIKSNFGLNASNNIGRFKVNSIYSKIYDYIEKRAMISQQNSTPAEHFAQKLVKKLLKPNPKAIIRIGKESFRIPFLKRILPRFLMEKIISKKFGLEKLKNIR